MRALVGLLLAMCASVVLARPAERRLDLDNGEYRIPALYQAAECAAARCPAVLLLHGTGSHKNEVGDLYLRLAGLLADAGIASLRIDFAGTGDSPVDYRHYTLESAQRDARTALGWLRGDPGIDVQRLAVLGFSQGGLIAQLVVAHDPSIAALVTWSTPAGDGVATLRDLYAQYHAQAERDGYVRIEFGWRAPLDFSRDWFRQVEAQTSLSDMRAFHGALLAIAGSDDDVVAPDNSQRLLAASGTDRGEMLLIKGADHIYRSLDPDAPQAGMLLMATRDWLLRSL